MSVASLGYAACEPFDADAGGDVAPEADGGGSHDGSGPLDEDGATPGDAGRRVLFADDFEGAKLVGDHWGVRQVSGTNSEVRVVDVDPASGARALLTRIGAAPVPDGGITSAFVETQIDGAAGGLRYAFSFRVDETPVSDAAPQLVTNRIRMGGLQVVLMVSPAGVIRLRVGYGQPMVYERFNLPDTALKTWTRLELEVDIESNPPRISAWVNAAQVIAAEPLAAQVDAAGAVTVGAGIMYLTNEQVPWRIGIDDVVVTTR